MKKKRKIKPKPRRRRPSARMDPAWVKACEEVVAAIGADCLRMNLRPVGEMVAPHVVKTVAREVTAQVNVTRHFVRRDVRAAIQQLNAYPELPPGYDPKLRLHYALISAAAQRAWYRGQVEDPTVAFLSMKATLERYFHERS